jgi:hypothetical protein
MEAIDIRAAGPEPEVAPNDESRRSTRVALIAGSGCTRDDDVDRASPSARSVHSGRRVTRTAAPSISAPGVEGAVTPPDRE